ncbi:MAG TPA: tetratricopeptide repeat protein [Blastocatellia bacterium]|jgi:tetratricopeptide (TPR) repeat protein|nr:tetratricopeptide repeat protein [Blastocatellia bacterium]
MIITPTRTASAYGALDGLTRPTIEEHLLERISALESTLQRANERIEIMLDLVHRQATTGLYDHAMLDALVEHLSERGSVDGGQLEVLWRERIAEQNEEVNGQERFERRLERMLGAFSGDDFDLFARLLDTGADLVAEGNSKRAIRHFEKAFVLDPENTVLAFFIGEYFFRANRPELARAYLERSVGEETDDLYMATLMLGVICGDDGDPGSAKRYLSRALKIKKNSFTAHYGLGRILVSEGRLREAISHFKRALNLKPTPEMYYVVGRAYLEDGRNEIAVRHLRRCVELDPRFDAALYHLGLIYLKQDDLMLAREHFRAAYEINPRESRYRTALRARKAGHLAPLPVFGRGAVSSRKVVTSGDVRLAELLRSDLLGSQSALSDMRKSQKRG